MHRISPFIMCLIIFLFSFQAHAETSEVVINGVGSVKVYVEKFVSKQHKIEMCGDYACLIDGIPFFGSDGKVPSKEITKMVFSHNGYTINLDVSAMYDPDIDNENIKTRIKVKHYWGQSYKVIGCFSDGAGAYFAQWIVTKEGSIRSHISDGESIYELFKEIFDE